MLAGLGLADSGQHSDGAAYALNPGAHLTVSFESQSVELALALPDDPTSRCFLQVRQYQADVDLKLAGGVASTTTPLNGHGLQFLSLPPTPLSPPKVVASRSSRSLPKGRLDFSYQCGDVDQPTHTGKLDLVGQLSLAGEQIAIDTPIDMQAALELYRAVIEYPSPAGLSLYIAYAHYFSAVLHQQLNQSELALDHFGDAVAYFTRLEVVEDLADVYSDWSLTLIDMGRFDQAREILGRAQEAVPDSDNQGLLGSIYSNRGLSYHYQGRLDKALDWYIQAEKAFTTAGDAVGLAQVANNIGGIYFDRNDRENARQYFDKALRSHEATGNLGEQATTLGNIGTLDIRSGRFSGALEPLSKAMRLTDRIGNRREIGRSRHRMGLAYLRLGKFERARALLQDGLSIRIDAGDYLGQAETLSALGFLFNQQGSPVLGLAANSAALYLNGFAENSYTLAAQQNRVANNLLQVPFWVPSSIARNLFTQSHNAASLAGLPRVLASSQHGLGLVAMSRKKYKSAQQHFSDAVRTSEEHDNPVQHAASLLALAQVLGAEEQPESAISTAEQAISQIERIRSRISSPTLRAQYFNTQRKGYELLVSLHASSGDAWEALSAAERFQARRLVESMRWSDPLSLPAVDSEDLAAYLNIAEELNLMASRSGLYSDRSNKVSTEWKSRYREKVQQLELLESRLALIEKVEPRSLREAARSLSNDELLVEVFLGENEGYVWTISTDGVEMSMLPSRKIMERLALSLFDGFSGATVKPGTQVAVQITELSGYLLSFARNKGVKRVYFVLDGALALTPLPALWLPGSRVFPHEQIEVAVAPSLSALALKRTSNTRPKRSIDGAFLLVGAPATSASPLTGSRQEVLELSKLVPGSVDLLLGSNATRQAILERDLSVYNLMHFATHGINTGDATASGLLVRQSRDEESDALISAKDIFTWRLRADLVTLSACETLRGDSTGGDGPDGIARAFAYAGARAVLGSLWKVDDAATRFFMSAFYSRYLEDGNATAALRYAQSRTARHPAWRDPYFWAGFQLHST